MLKIQIQGSSTEQKKNPSSLITLYMYKREWLLSCNQSILV